tara:strand:- start:62 stop:448 length:387 start_codon:yes stop_codon:yes gene_type:complete
MGLSWLQSAVRTLHKVQDKVAAATITITLDGSDLIVPARLDVVAGESVSFEGLTTFYTERVFKITKSRLPREPKRGDHIELHIYDELGRKAESEHYIVMSEQGLEPSAAQGNFEDAYRVYAKRTPNGS